MVLDRGIGYVFAVLAGFSLLFFSCHRGPDGLQDYRYDTMDKEPNSRFFTDIQDFSSSPVHAGSSGIGLLRRQGRVENEHNGGKDLL
jgi:hypothetical protein